MILHNFLAIHWMVGGNTYLFPTYNYANICNSCDVLLLYCFIHSLSIAPLLWIIIFYIVHYINIALWLMFYFPYEIFFFLLCSILACSTVESLGMQQVLKLMHTLQVLRKYKLFCCLVTSQDLCSCLWLASYKFSNRKIN